MRILICGTGERERYLSALAQARGHTLPNHGPWDMAVLALPRSSISEEYADQLPKGQKIVCGITEAAFDALSLKRGWQIKRVLEDEAYILENAALTAEGALCAAMNRLPGTVRGAKCLVIGYGRIGKALTRMLRAQGALVTVAARRKESREEAGKNSISIQAVKDVLPHMDAVFNTVPAPVLGRELLQRAKGDAVLMELASPPYGMDLEAAREMGVKVDLESGLPGRYCPKAAAEALLNYMEREAQNE